jgi:predicted DCC family thiol-disulfide oxidoreductase YuxK
MSGPEKLTVVYDEECALCRRCRQWLEGQPTHVPLEFLAAGAAAARDRYGSVPWLGADLVVADEQGNVWAGPAAFLMCLWATVQYREWSYRLSGRTLAPLAERFFLFVSHNRRRIGRVVGSNDCPDGRCGHRAQGVPTPVPAAGGAWAPPPAPRDEAAVCHACGAPVWVSQPVCWSCGSPR